jgi:hypothetical protein
MHHVLFLAPLLVNLQDTVRVEKVQRAFTALVQVVTTPGPQTSDSARFVEITDRVPKGSLLAEFLAAHGPMVWYLASHTPRARPRPLQPSEDADAVRDSMVHVLQADSAFNARVLPMLARYWRIQGRVLEGHGSSTTALPAVTLDALRQVAVRFFYPDSVSASGDRLFTYICAGVNGLADLPERPDPVVEAFVFAAVQKAVFQPHSRLMRDFNEAMEFAEVVSRSTDRRMRIHRAQGALWARLASSPEMTRVLRAAYTERRSVLPFRLSPGS